MQVKKKVVMMKIIEEFADKFGSNISFGNEYIINKDKWLFLIDKKFQKYPKSFFYAGLCLGKIKNGKIIPSLVFLSILSRNKANKVFLNNRASWQFICGKDICFNGILSYKGAIIKGDLSLVLNSYNDCLGYGKVVSNIDLKEKNQIFLKNLLDIGDYLRREK